MISPALSPDPRPFFRRAPARNWPGASGAHEERAAFLLQLREQGIRNLAVLRAMEAIPRSSFVASGHAALTYRNVALPIPCGQCCPAPLDTARMLQGAELHPEMLVLEAGTGSGYATALLSALVQRVVSVERYRTLVQYAKQRLSAFENANVSLQWADALDLPTLGVFDCLIVHGVVDPLPDGIWRHLVEGGSIIHGRWTTSARSQVLVRTRRGPDGTPQQFVLGRTRLQALEGGLPVRI